jgi:uncharacterized Fe-S cluster-containing radical SAM superfamily protein
MTAERLNYSFQRAYRAVRRCLLVIYAAVTRKRFYCVALSGESAYNICINSDMTVSCNCQDYDGSGHIGDLNSETLEEVLASPRATHFRNSLASGRLPLLICASCSELRLTKINEARRRAENWQMCTNGIMVENTVACPYRCTACYRTLVQQNRRSTHMTLANVLKVATTIRKHGIKSLSFFNLGETFAAHDIGDQLHIIREYNPNLYIAISTNGILLNTAKKRDAAMLADSIMFSIDGIDDHTMNKYQRGASFSKSYDNMKQLVEHRRKRGKTRPTIEWKYVLFNWNDRESMILQAIELARNAGVDIISFWPTMSPFYGISWRYHLKTFYRNLGESTWKGREIHLDQLSALSNEDNPRR